MKRYIRKKGKTDKLLPKWIGPWEILEVEEETGNCQVIRFPSMSKLQWVATDRLKPYYGERESSWDSEQDADDEMEEELWEVEKVLDYEDRDGEDYFLVKWKGYDDDEITWEPREHLYGAMDTLIDYWKTKATRGPNTQHITRNVKWQPTTQATYGEVQYGIGDGMVSDWYQPSDDGIDDEGIDN